MQTLAAIRDVNEHLYQFGFNTQPGGGLYYLKKKVTVPFILNKKELILLTQENNSFHTEIKSPKAGQRLQI